MSNYAITEYDDQYMTAWEFRSIFIGEGVRFDDFYCPFCYIKLCACLVYLDEEITKSPYFSARWEDHKLNCDGEPIFTNDAKRNVPKGYYDPRVMNFPEELTARPAPRKRIKKSKPNSLNLSNLDVFEKRTKAGLLGRPIPKSYLLQPFVEVYNSVWREGFSKVKEKIWDKNDCARLTKEILCDMPLVLEDNTNYSDAFQSPSFLNERYDRIYFNDGIVKTFQDGFIITSNKDAKVKNQSFPFSIKIYDVLLNDDSPMSHIALFKALKGYAENNIAIRWYAYGNPTLKKDFYELLVINLDYLYIKRSFQKQSK